MTFEPSSAPKINRDTPDTGRTTAYCPYLGMKGDSVTRYDYASIHNYCHKPETPAPILLLHQSECCLSDDHHSCPVYKSNFNGIFPDNIKGQLEAPPISTRRIITTGLLVLVIFLFVYIGFFSNKGADGQALGGAVAAQPLDVDEIPTVTESLLTPTSFATPANTSVVDVDSVPVVDEIQPEDLSATATLALSPFPTNTPFPTTTPFPTPGPGFETPFGPAQQFLIHVVQANESLALLANRYNTSIGTLEAVNLFEEGASLWEGKQLVVPIGVTDPTGLPKFSVLYLTQNASLENLAREYGAEIGQLRFFNALGDADTIPAGRWLIIPVFES